MPGTWSFQPKPPGQVKRDPFEDVFFIGEEEDEQAFGRTDGLVRETIQNALDARRADRDTVRVSYRVLVEPPTPSAEVHGRYLADLVPHLVACDNALARGGDMPDEPNRLLVYEDFGTRGLEGDPGRYQDPPPRDSNDADAPREDFYWFWRNVGRSGKSGQDLGRWGLGKSVLPATSRINCMLGLTQRAADGKRLLMGQAVLRGHSVDGDERVPEGFFHGGTDDLGVPLPISDEATLDAFTRDFALRRGADEPGLSVVVPHCYPKLRARELLRSALLHFFVPILRGRLIVEVEGPNTPFTRLDADSISGIAGGMEWSGKISEKKHQPPPTDFARWALQRHADGDATTLHPAGVGHAPDWSADLVPDAALDTLRERYGRGEPVAIRVPLHLELRAGEPERTFFDAFLQRDEARDSPAGYCVREGMTISGIQALRGRRGVQGLLLVDDRLLSTLLGDTEGPSHEDWGTGTTRPDARFKTWKGRVRFVRDALRRLDDLLTPPPKQMDRDLLADVFSLPDPRDAGRRGQAPDDEGKSPVPHLRDLDPAPRWYRLTGFNGGFNLRPSPAAPRPEPAVLSVHIAYDISRGDPLKAWSPFDFNLRKKEIKFNGEAVALSAEAGNTLRVEAQGDEWRLRVSGFDLHRDLYVRVVEVKPDAPDEPEDDADAAAAVGRNGSPT